MTEELEALKTVVNRAKQLPDADPELEEALQVVDRLIQTVEQAEADPHRALLLVEACCAKSETRL